MPLDIEQSLKSARELIENQQDENARMLLLELLKEDANNIAALLMLGGSYFSSGKYAEAEMAFDRLILIEPGNGRFSIALFNVLWKMNRSEEALEEIKRFMKIADRDIEQETINQYTAIINTLTSQT